MILSLATTHPPATDLGYLLHKNPSRVHVVELAFGIARVAYPTATDDRCEALLWVDVDPVDLVRGREGSREGGLLDQYVNDRPYAASSMLASAVNKVFGTALGGRSKDRPELAATAIPLEVRIPVLPVRGGEAYLRAVFDPLGIAVEAKAIPLDPAFPEWGPSRYWDVTLKGTLRLSEMLAYLVVLLPVFDDQKHYDFGSDEVDKLLRRGEGWLSTHPLKEDITRRYLRHRGKLTREALARLTEDESEDVDAEAVAETEAKEAREKPMRLHDLRLDRVAEVLAASGARRVADLGCGEGALIARLRKHAQFTEIVGMDVSLRSLRSASRKLRLDEAPPHQQNRIRLTHGSLLYRDARLEGWDAAALVEVIEHLDAGRLRNLESTVFRSMAPDTVVVTTPNSEYNVRFESLPAGTMRHGDHRFEWTRAEFAAWCQRVAEAHGYAFHIEPLGPEDAEVGAPSQLAVFSRNGGVDGA